MKTVFLFPGQGAQYPGMTADIAAAYPAAMACFRQADALLERPLSNLIFTGTAEELNQTENTQPALLTCEMAAFSVLRESGILCDAFAGFSLGEWSALTAAGALSFVKALPVVAQRACFMQGAVPLGKGGMAVVLGKTAEDVQALCARAQGVTPSNFNCPGQITVAGTTEGVDRLLAIAAKEHIVAKKLAISVPSHCELMRPAAEQLAEAVGSIPFNDIDKPLVMNCTAQPEKQGEIIRGNMIRQLTQPVRFEETIRYLLSQGADTFVEIGPGKTLTGLVKKTAKSADVPVTTLRTDTKELMDETIAALGGGAHV